MPDFDDLQFNKPEDEVDFSNMSLDDLLESTKEELEEDEAAQAAEGGSAIIHDPFPRAVAARGFLNQ